MRVAFLGNFGVTYSSESHHAATLESLGHEVVRLQEPQASADEILEEAKQSDLFVWVHTHGWDTPGIDETLNELRFRGVPSLTYHLDLWIGLQRQQKMRTDPYWQIDHFFTVDRCMADWLNNNTPVKGHYLTAGVYDKECYISDQPFASPHANDVIFVGSYGYHPEWAYRPQLIDWLHQTYGDRFTRIAGDTVGTTRGDDLNRLYASSKVVVGDSLCLNFDYPDYWSDRVYETLGRGGFLIHPYVQGMDRQFTDGQHLAFYKYGEFDQLRETIDYYLEHDDQREQMRRAGHEHVKLNHTYRQRWQCILDTIHA